MNLKISYGIVEEFSLLFDITKVVSVENIGFEKVSCLNALCITILVFLELHIIMETATQRRDVPPCPPQYICLDFLLGHCSKEQLCDHYHYNVPYMWQYKDPSSDHQGDTWKPFTQSENEAIEQQFCDVNVLDAEMEHTMIPTPPSVL